LTLCLCEQNVEEKEVEDYLTYKAQMISKDIDATILGQLILFFRVILHIFFVHFPFIDSTLMIELILLLYQRAIKCTLRKVRIGQTR